MVKLIRPDTVAFRTSVTEEEIRERLAHEMLEAIGGLDENDKPLRGLKVVVHRGESRKGGYSIEVTGPAPARIMRPPPVAG